MDLEVDRPACGLNGYGMEFRAKLAKRVFEEIEDQYERYGVDHFSATDNILSYREGPNLFKMLAGNPNSYRLFYEVKANISRAQIHELLRRGMREV